MYVPKSFAEPDQDRLHQFIETHSFATLISQHSPEILASHLPLLLDRSVGHHGRLVGHMARANPHWQQAADKEVLIIFQGAHAYISPTWYEDSNVVPTWNYVAVHVYGTLRLETNRLRLLEIVRESVEYFEAGLPQAWSLEQVEAEFVDGLLEAIVGFEIEIDRIEGKWKLNQNHDEIRRTKVIDALRQSDGENQRKIADLIEQTLET